MLIVGIMYLFPWSAAALSCNDLSKGLCNLYGLNYSARNQVPTNRINYGQRCHTIGQADYQAVYADAQLAEYRDQIEILRQQLEAKDEQISSLQQIIQTLVAQQSPKYDLRGAQFSGGFAETVRGDQIGSIQQIPPSNTS
ncbi:MAG: hypothetical protein AAF722_05275 [Cyanobacteria bacterium P01_C01_bin.70]